MISLMLLGKLTGSNTDMLNMSIAYSILDLSEKIRTNRPNFAGSRTHQRTCMIFKAACSATRSRLTPTPCMA